MAPASRTDTLRGLDALTRFRPPSFIGTGPLLRTRGVDSSSSALTGLSGTEAGAQRWPVREIASAEGPKRDTREPGVSWQSAASNQSPPAHSRPTVRTPATPARDQRNPAAARSLIGASIIGPLDAVLSCLLDDSTNQTLPQDFRELSRLKGEATAAPRWDEQQPRKRRRLLAVRYPHFVSDPRPALQKNDAIERLVADAVEKASAFVPKASSTSASAFPLGDSLKAYGANISGSSSGTDSTSLSGPAATTGIKDLFGGASETASGGTASGKLLFGAASGEAKSLFGATSGTGTESKSGNLFGFGSGSGSLPPVAEAKSLFGSDSQAGPTKNIFGAASDTSGGESKSLFGESAGEGVKVQSLFGVDSISASTGGEAKSLFGATSGTGTESKSGNLFGFGGGSGSLPPVAEAKSLFGSDSQAGPTKNIFGAASDTSGGESKSLFGESAGEGVKVKSLFGVDSIGSSAGLFSFGSAASADSAGERGGDRPAKASRRMGDASRGGDVEEGEEAQPSQASQPRKADPEVLAKRRMVRARRSSTAGDAAYPPPAAAIEVLDDSPVQPDKASAPSFFTGMAAVASSTAPEPSAPSAAGVPEESSKEPEAETGPIKVETKEDLWRVQIEAIYRRRNHHKLGDVKGMMEKYKGKEVVLFKKVCLRYDLDPKKLYTDPKSWDDEDKDVKDEGEEEKPAGGVAAVADLFGGNSSGSGLFSAAPASSGGLFDTPTASSGSIFGGSSGGGGLFAAPASGGSSPPASLFGSSFATPSAPAASGSLFGGGAP
ncbi:unnamed protein product, partial [Polarella glacialis]